MAGPRFSIIQELAAPPDMACRTAPRSAPDLAANTSPSHIAAMLPSPVIWLASFVTWPMPLGPQWVILLPMASRTGMARFDGVLVTADHDREGACLCAVDSAADWRVNHVDALFGQALRYRAGHGGGYGAHVDDDRARGRTLDHAVGAGDDVLHVWGIGDAGDDDLAAAGRVFGRSGRGCARVGQGFHAGRGAVPDGDLVAGLHEVHAHGSTYQSQTNEADSGHAEVSWKRRCRYGRRESAQIIARSAVVDRLPSARWSEWGVLRQGCRMSSLYIPPLHWVA